MKKTIFFFLFAVNLLFAQDYGNDSEALKLCSVLQTNQFGTDVEAENALDKILNAIGASKRFVLQPCSNINNAVATSYKGIRYILYDRDFMNSVNYGNNWGNLFVLAHEVGHHINGHSLDLVLYAANAVGQQTLAQSRQDELEADEFAGFILAKLGGPLSAANEVISSFSSNRDDTYSTHPNTSKRLAAVKRGYLKFSGIQKNNNNSNMNNSNDSFDVIYYSNGRWEGPVKTTKQKVVLSTGTLGTKTSRTPYGKGVFVYNNGEIYEGYFKNDLLNTKKDLSEDYYYKAVDEFKSSDYNKALESINSAISLSPNDYRFYSKKGDILGAQEKFFEAISNFNKAIELNENDYWSLKGLMWMHHFLGLNSKDENSNHTEISNNFYLEFCDKSKDVDAEEYFQCGKIYFDRRDLLKADDFLTKSIKLEPYPFAHFYRGLVYGFSGENYKAINEFTSMIEITDDSSNKALAYYYRAVGKNQINDENGYCNDMRKAYELDPQSKYQDSTCN
jgi:tetratricopeptide (TPR) repeat protein